jgi:hypothetical protein
MPAFGRLQNGRETSRTFDFKSAKLLLAPQKCTCAAKSLPAATEVLAEKEGFELNLLYCRLLLISVYAPFEELHLHS